jgi:hypothetical protein
MDWAFIISAFLCVPIAASWWWRRRKIVRGETCWNCGANLLDRSPFDTFRGAGRCPQCGDDIEADDAEEFPDID